MLCLNAGSSDRFVFVFESPILAWIVSGKLHRILRNHGFSASQIAAHFYWRQFMMPLVHSADGFGQLQVDKPVCPMGANRNLALCLDVSVRP